MGKFCANCGAELREGSDICLNCGKMINNFTTEVKTTTNTVSTKTNGLAVAGFVVSLCSLIINFAGLVGATGAILSSVGLAQLKKKNETGFGLALTGIIVGGFSVIYGIFTLINLISIFQ